MLSEARVGRKLSQMNRHDAPILGVEDELEKAPFMDKLAYPDVHPTSILPCPEPLANRTYTLPTKGMDHPSVTFLRYDYSVRVAIESTAVELLVKQTIGHVTPSTLT